MDACETEAKLLLFEILCNYIDLGKFCGPFCVIFEGIIPISFILSSFFSFFYFLFCLKDLEREEKGYSFYNFFLSLN